MYSSLKESGLLQQARERDNRVKVNQALDELVQKDVIAKYRQDEHKTGNKIVDVKYTITPTLEFIKEQKAANKRLKDNNWAIPVDK